MKFCQTFRPISISLSPNTEKDDIDLALKSILKPWHWKNGSTSSPQDGSTGSPQEENAIEKLEKEFKNYLGAKHAISFNSGRSAFLAILKSLNLNESNDVLLQAFTCNAAVNPILWAGLKPVYVDCDEKTFNIDTEDLKRKITHSTSSGQAPKVVVVQHTFGLPSEMDEILGICQKNNLILIEDCAHSLGANYQTGRSAPCNSLGIKKSQKVGTFGKAAFFSFSRDKVISSVYGGIVVTNDDALAKKLREFQGKVDYPSNFWIFQQILHPILMNYLILPAYSLLRIGKTLLSVFQWLKILSKAVHWKEKRGRKPNYFPKRMPNALAILALNQFKKLKKLNQHRQEIANFYQNELRNTDFELPINQKQIFLRFTIKHPKAHQVIKKSWQKNILIGDWYTTPIAPHDTKLDKIQYQFGSCPKAEKLSKETFNLPTHINISPKEAQKIITFLKQSL